MKIAAKKTNKKAVSPATTPRRRLLVWQNIRGLWKNKKPDPINELKKMRKEWAT